MTFTALKFLLKRCGYFVVDNWRYIVIFSSIAVLFAVMTGLNRSCGRAKINLKEIEKINSANEKERMKALETTINENAETVKTVDGRNRIAELSEAERQAAIWAKIQEANRKIEEAKTNGRDVTGAELECLLTGVCP